MMWSESVAWGAIPQGYVKRIDAHGHRLIVRRERAHEIDFSVCSSAGATTKDSAYRGRSAIRIFRLPDGENALVRQYYHGGVLRALMNQWYFTWPPRPFRELTVTEELHRRGLRTVEVLAACIRRGPGPFYRGWLVTRELRGAADLWSALRDGLVQDLGLEATLRAVAEAIGSMHREGVYHRDLNLKNILVRRESDRVASYIIDFDRAALFKGKLPPELVARNLDRLLRSVRKLDPKRRYFSVPAWDELQAFYHEISPA